MALVQLGGGVTDIRGSIAGTTYSRSAAGNYARAKTKPVNPRLNTQSVARQRFAYLSWFWGMVLNQAQRDNWQDYADGTTWTNALGQSITMSGISAFIYVNGLRLRAGLAIRSEKPILPGNAPEISCTITATADDDKVGIASQPATFDPADPLNSLVLAIFLPGATGTARGRKGKIHLTTLTGNVGAPIAFPYEIISPYKFEEGQKITMAIAYIDSSYRRSAEVLNTLAATAA